MKHVKFLRLAVSDAPVTIDRVALPLLQMYKRGECIHTIAAVHIEACQRRYQNITQTHFSNKLTFYIYCDCVARYSDGVALTAELIERGSRESTRFTKDDIEWLLNSTNLFS